MAIEEKKDLIAKTFMEMAMTMPVEDIRVGALIARAGFYRLFHDKYDVMNWTYLMAMEPIITRQPQLTHVRTWSYASYAYIRENKRFFRNIIAYRGQNSFYDFMAAYFARNMQNAIREREGEEALSEKIQFSIEAYSHVCAFTIGKWIQGNCEMDVDVLTGYTQEWIPDCLRPFYER